MKIQITSQGTGFSTHVHDELGNRVQGVAEVHIHPIQPQEVVTAEITFHLACIDIEAEALLALENVRDCAAYYGFRLVPLEEDGDGATDPAAGA